MTTGHSGSSYMSSRRSIWMCWCKGCLPMRSPQRHVLPQSLTVCVCYSDLKCVLYFVSGLVSSHLVCFVFWNLVLKHYLNPPAWLCIKSEHCIIHLLLHLRLKQYLKICTWLCHLLASSQTDVSTKQQCTTVYMHLNISEASAHASEAYSAVILSTEFPADVVVVTSSLHLV